VTCPNHRANPQPGPAARRTIHAMNERSEDDPGADTAMFRAYVEHGDGAETRPSLAIRPAILIGAAVAVVLVVLGLILAM
jgi:hypothetical protein